MEDYASKKEIIKEKLNIFNKYVIHVVSGTFHVVCHTNIKKVISVHQKNDNVKWKAYIDIDKETCGEVTMSLGNT